MMGEFSSPATRVSEWHEPLLGTFVEVQLVLHDLGQENAAATIIRESIAEIARLQQVFSSVDQSSEFSRWTRGELTTPSQELTTILRASLDWYTTSGGRFNPAVAQLSRAWTAAEVSGIVPSPWHMQSLADDIADAPWTINPSGVPIARAGANGCTLNAFAKGWIVDRAIEVVQQCDGVRSVTINVGGDLRRWGPDPLIVGIENPFRPFDNEPPLTAVELRDGALATSGSARKYFEFGAQRFSHILDPRSGWPVQSLASISVVASTAAEADVLATTLGVNAAAAAIGEANQSDLAVFIVAADGNQHRSERWSEIEASVS